MSFVIRNGIVYKLSNVVVNSELQQYIQLLFKDGVNTKILEKNLNKLSLRTNILFDEKGKRNMIDHLYNIIRSELIIYSKLGDLYFIPNLTSSQKKYCEEIISYLELILNNKRTKIKPSELDCYCSTLSDIIGLKFKELSRFKK